MALAVQRRNAGKALSSARRDEASADLSTLSHPPDRVQSARAPEREYSRIVIDLFGVDRGRITAFH